jgi:hypothetical protein
MKPETELQIQVANVLRLYEALRGFIFFSVPNELLGSATGRGGMGRMARFKRMGLRPGVTDIVIVRGGKAFFLELKSPVGVQSDSQIQFCADATRAGAECAVARSFDEALDALSMWGILP